MVKPFIEETKLLHYLSIVEDSDNPLWSSAFQRDVSMAFIWHVVLSMISSVTGDLPFASPKSARQIWSNFSKPEYSNVFFAHVNGHPSITKIFDALFAEVRIQLIQPPIPARQNILPIPSLLSLRAILSAISPVSEAPEQAKINLEPGLQR